MSDHNDTKCKEKRKNKKSKTNKTKEPKPEKQKEDKPNKIYDNYEECLARLLTIRIMR